MLLQEQCYNMEKKIDYTNSTFKKLSDQTYWKVAGAFL